MNCNYVLNKLNRQFHTGLPACLLSFNNPTPELSLWNSTSATHFSPPPSSSQTPETGGGEGKKGKEGLLAFS